jgi:hypothetical protein
MMAGNVTVAVSNGELLITGNNLNNRIEITEVAGSDNSYRTFRVEGKPFDGAFDSNYLPVAGSSPTTINGGSSAVQMFISTDKVRVLMNAGYDAVSFKGTSSHQATTAGLAIFGGAGRDSVDVEYMRLVGNNTTLTVNTGADSEANNERVDLRYIGPTTGAVNATQNLSVITGGGADRFYADHVRLGGNTNVNLGSGGDILTAYALTLGAVTVNAGSTGERDVVNVGGLGATSATVTLGGGNDLLNITSASIITNLVTIDGGDGSQDELRGDMSIDAGSSNVSNFELYS